MHIIKKIITINFNTNNVKDLVLCSIYDIYYKN